MYQYHSAHLARKHQGLLLINSPVHMPHSRQTYAVLTRLSEDGNTMHHHPSPSQLVSSAYGLSCSVPKVRDLIGPVAGAKHRKPRGSATATHPPVGFVISRSVAILSDRPFRPVMLPPEDQSGLATTRQLSLPHQEGRAVMQSITKSRHHQIHDPGMRLGTSLPETTAPPSTPGTLESVPTKSPCCRQ